GPKKAAQYLQKYGDVEGVIANAKAIGGKTGERILEHAEDARMSRVLATIRLDVPMDVTLESLAPRGLQEDTLRTLFDKGEFGKVARRLLSDRLAADTSCYTAVTTAEQVKTLVSALREAGRFAVGVETHGADPLSADVLGLAFCWGEEDAAYVPLRKRSADQVDPDAALAALAPLLADPK